MHFFFLTADFWQFGAVLLRRKTNKTMFNY